MAVVADWLCMPCHGATLESGVQPRQALLSRTFSVLELHGCTAGLENDACLFPVIFSDILVQYHIRHNFISNMAAVPRRDSGCFLA